MFLQRLLPCVITAVGIASFQMSHAQPVRSCPEGQAVNSLLPNGTPVQCIDVDAAIAAEAAQRANFDAKLQNSINNEINTRGAKDATLLTLIVEEIEARKAAIEALQPPPPTGATRCYGIHLVRGVNGNELQLTTLFFNNGDLENPAVVERITIRDDQGNILHDSGPKTGRPHPFTTVTIPPSDITNVPAGGTLPFSSVDLWGFNNVPQLAGRGNLSISLTAEISKAGDPKLLVVHARQIGRQRLVDFPVPGAISLGDERSNNDSTCFSVPRS